MKYYQKLNENLIKNVRMNQAAKPTLPGVSLLKNKSLSLLHDL